MNKIAVIRIGGHSFSDKNCFNVLIRNIKFLKKLKFNVVLCHGGCPTINEKLKEKNIDSEFINGYRVTTPEIMEVVHEAMLGKEALNIIKKLNQSGLQSVSINGNDAFCIKCRKKTEANIDYGQVGEIYDINTDLINVLMENDYIPVVSPVGTDDLGNSYNLNSDFLASKLANKLGADLFLMVTNVDGVYEDENCKKIIHNLDNKLYKKLIKKGSIGSTMRTKLDALMEYSKYTMNTSYLIHTSQLLSYDLFYLDTIGTKVSYDNVNIRLALKEDVPNIIDLMRDSFPQYQRYIDYQIYPLVEEEFDLYSDMLNNLLFVLYSDGKLVGHIRFKFDNKNARIYRVCVLPEYQNKGIGSLLLKYIENYAKIHGIKSIGLTTIYGVDYLNKFYAKNDYKLYSSNDSRGYTRALMIKELEFDEKILNTNLYWQK